MTESPESKAETVKAKELVIPSQFDLDKKEFENLIAQLDKGKSPSKDARSRISVLARRLSNESQDFDWIATAKAANAYDSRDREKLATTKAQMAERVDTVEQWLIWGWSRGKIMTKGAETWQLAHTSLKNYIFRAQTRIQQRLDRTRESQEGLLSARLADVYAMAREKGNLPAMIEALDRQAKLLGFHRPPVTRIEFMGKAGQTLSVLNLPDKDDDGSGRVIDVETTPKAKQLPSVPEDDEFATG